MPPRLLHIGFVNVLTVWIGEVSRWYIMHHRLTSILLAGWQGGHAGINGRMGAPHHHSMIEQSGSSFTTLVRLACCRTQLATNVMPASCAVLHAFTVLPRHM